MVSKTMSVENQLFELKNKIDKELEEFFDCKIKQIKDQKRPHELLEMAKNLRSFVLRSGKRIRPILFYYGYLVAGGKKKKEILKTAISVELVHSYLLIHDDIIDQDSFRHGSLSMHCKYEKEYQNRFKNKQLKHFGTSMAIVVGDLASAFGYEVLTSSDFSGSLKIKALDKLNDIISNTTLGQALDLILEMRESINLKEIFEMQRYKTAKYTIEGPLHLGAILAGADEKLLGSISRFAIPLGVAFQIQDDIIGVFGDENKIGKPIGSDIREGKKTLLIFKAVEKATEGQKKTLDRALGNKNITIDEIKTVRNIIVSTGSLEFSKNKARELKEFSLKCLTKIKEISNENKKFLRDLADFIVRRKY